MYRRGGYGETGRTYVNNSSLCPDDVLASKLIHATVSPPPDNRRINKYTPLGGTIWPETELPNIPSLPKLVSQFLISQQAFAVDFGEHGLAINRIFATTLCP